MNPQDSTQNIEKQTDKRRATLMTPNIKTEEILKNS